MNKEQIEELKRLAAAALLNGFDLNAMTNAEFGACMKDKRAFPNAANPQAITELIAALEAAEKDADRYRFWRNRYPETFNPTDITPEDVDRLTDKAMEAK